MSQTTIAEPFALTTSPAVYLPRPDTERALDELEEWVENGTTSSIWITGPPGMGKTLLLRVLADRLTGRRLCVYILYPVLDPKQLATWVLDALGELVGDAPQDRIAGLAEQRAEQGGLLLLIDDAMWMPPATRSALDDWYRESNGALRSVLAATDSPSSMGARGSSGDARLSLDEPLSLEQSRALLAAAMERIQLGAEARAIFDPATVEELHERAGGVPMRLLIDADRLLFVRRKEVALDTSAPLLKWRASAGAAPEPTPESLARPAAEPVPEPSLSTAAAGPVLESGRALGASGDRELPPPVRPQRRRFLNAALWCAGALSAGVLATTIAIQLLGGDPEPTVAPLTVAPVSAPASLPAVAAAPPPASAPRPTTAAAPARGTATDGGQIVTEGVIREGEWLAASFRRLDIPMPILTLIDHAVGDVFDFKRSRPGHRYTVTRDAVGELVTFRYLIGPRDELRVRRTGENYTVTRSAPLRRGSFRPYARTRPPRTG